jgi:hypothetical protein
MAIYARAGRLHGSTLRNEGYVVKILKIVKELGWVSGATIVTKEDDEGKAA